MKNTIKYGMLFRDSRLQEILKLIDEIDKMDTDFTIQNLRKNCQKIRKLLGTERGRK